MKTNHLFMLVAIFALSTGCAKQQFDKLEKANAINDPVFGEHDDNGGNYGTGENDGSGNYGTGENDGSGNYGTGENDGGGKYGTGENDMGPAPDFDHYTGEYDHEPFLFCSDSRTKWVGYNLVSATKLEVRLVDASGKTVCAITDTASIKNEIVNKKNIPIPNCAAATANKYSLKLLDPTKSNTVFGVDLINFAAQKAFVVRKNSSSPWAFIDRAGQDDPVDSLDVVYNGNKGITDSNCDQKSSPLVVKTEKADHSGIQLTSQADGIRFDILGENAKPYSHAKQQISWITKDSYQFLVKPNASGKVMGIDEMFGDNTKGPDGEFADNGYAALAKYDLNKDGVIDSKDAIYKDLKLWSDKNRDGRSQKDELVSLSDAGLIAIDLAYDDSFREVDQYGNETKMKSVVKYSDDSYRLIFDLWFNHAGMNRKR